MYSSCVRESHTAGAAAAARGKQYYEPCNRETASGGGQGIVFSAADAPPRPGRRPRRRHSASSSASARRSSTTVVATDVGNFRAMVQELTGFPPAAIFRPLPRRAHAAGQFLQAAVLQQGQYNSSDAAGGGSGSSTTTSPDVQGAAVAQPSQYYCATPGVFDGLADIGSPGFDAWPELSFE
ncbi:uncharacterized protein LOC100841749 [Brachypodium distachyon]|uniref:VQ domain-containing protein n=1 Tax=Brachypodium distachyon TaxID=15368 RepID=I1IF39_BRADI|nr:uncharacterized protein LOC100841749 [Brachypodium distachyon]PNT69613.1 hypothetical protein BRADI_3g58880v3 [Brachypodium distachyon]|eukprot:XP_003573081.1 uncharacterized protein LOC100841749 [Brachypodium distachyon]